MSGPMTIAEVVGLLKDRAEFLNKKRRVGPITEWQEGRLMELEFLIKRLAE